MNSRGRCCRGCRWLGHICCVVVLRERCCASGRPVVHLSPSEAANQTVKSKEASNWLEATCGKMYFVAVPLSTTGVSLQSGHMITFTVIMWGRVIGWTNQIPSLYTSAGVWLQLQGFLLGKKQRLFHSSWISPSYSADSCRKKNVEFPIGQFISLINKIQLTVRSLLLENVYGLHCDTAIDARKASQNVYWESQPRGEKNLSLTSETSPTRDFPSLELNGRYGRQITKSFIKTCKRVFILLFFFPALSLPFFSFFRPPEVFCFFCVTLSGPSHAECRLQLGWIKWQLSCSVSQRAVTGRHRFGTVRMLDLAKPLTTAWNSNQNSTARLNGKWTALI